MSNSKNNSSDSSNEKNGNANTTDNSNEVPPSGTWGKIKNRLSKSDEDKQRRALQLSKKAQQRLLTWQTRSGSLLASDLIEEHPQQCYQPPTIREAEASRTEPTMTSIATVVEKDITEEEEAAVFPVGDGDKADGGVTRSASMSLQSLNLMSRDPSESVPQSPEDAFLPQRPRSNMISRYVGRLFKGDTPKPLDLPPEDVDVIARTSAEEKKQKKIRDYDRVLWECETAILQGLRPLISQFTVAGLNTISSVHPKVSHEKYEESITQLRHDLLNRESIVSVSLAKDKERYDSTSPVKITKPRIITTEFTHLTERTILRPHCGFTSNFFSRGSGRLQSVDTISSCPDSPCSASGSGTDAPENASVNDSKQSFLKRLRTRLRIKENETENPTPSPNFQPPPTKQTATLDPLSQDSHDIIVCIHGFAGGIGNWVPIWRDLIPHADVYAFDLPGFGRSVRPKREFECPEESVDFFMHYFDKWFIEMNFDRKVIIIAHSYGGYMSCHFAMRYGHRIKRLILLDPWGIPKYDPQGRDVMSTPFKIAYWWFYNVGGTPFTLLRATGPLGPTVLSRLRPDFGDRWDIYVGDREIFYRYTYYCNAHPKTTGEEAFKMSATGPCCPRVHLDGTLEKLLPRDFPISFIFGLYSDFDVDCVFEMHKRMIDAGYDSTFDRIRGGHQLMTDNNVDTAKTILFRCGYTKE